VWIFLAVGVRTKESRGAFCGGRVCELESRAFIIIPPREAPNSNIQAPEKLQEPSSKLARANWCLMFGISLELGCWCLELHNNSSTASDSKRLSAGETPALPGKSEFRGEVSPISLFPVSPCSPSLPQLVRRIRGLNAITFGVQRSMFGIRCFPCSHFPIPYCSFFFS